MARGFDALDVPALRVEHLFNRLVASLCPVQARGPLKLLLLLDSRLNFGSRPLFLQLATHFMAAPSRLDLLLHLGALRGLLPHVVDDRSTLDPPRLPKSLS